jgi:hypothetical protein
MITSLYAKLGAIAAILLVGIVIGWKLHKRFSDGAVRMAEARARLAEAQADRQRAKAEKWANFWRRRHPTEAMPELADDTDPFTRHRLGCPSCGSDDPETPLCPEGFRALQEAIKEGKP